jgi:BirA family biotin operon repressor/biotin-[acetyl-CoA-carboxylase] ligase
MESQSAGRGRGGRPWVSPAGHIYAALLLPSAPPFDGPGAALALAWFLAEALAEGGWSLLIKWPNDLILEGGKAAGILLEARRGLVVAGVGLNLGAPPPEVERGPGRPPPAALPGAPPPGELWPELVKNVSLRYNSRIAPWTMAETAAEAEKRLWRRNGLIRVLAPAADPPARSGELAGRLAGLGPEGQLLLAAGGRLSQIWSGTLIPDRDGENDDR